MSFEAYYACIPRELPDDFLLEVTPFPSSLAVLHTSVLGSYTVLAAFNGRHQWS